MFSLDRLRIIKGILLDKRHIEVSALSSMLNVSEVTIRRDLEKLEKENFLRRTYGGALINEDIHETEEMEKFRDSSLDDPIYEDRIQISKVASFMINDNDAIILSPGPTNLCIATSLLNKKNITILTNDLNIAFELSANTTHRVIVLGGDLNPATMSLSGKITEETIKNLFVHKAFIEVQGASMQKGFTVSGIDSAYVIKEMLNITNQRIFVCHDKAFDNISLYPIGDLGIADTIITTPQAPTHYKNFFFEKNIKFCTSSNAYEVI